MQDKNKTMSDLYIKNQKRIFDFLYKYVNNQETAMDLTQETFLSFYKNYGDASLTPEKSLMLLYTIARNNSINHSKKFSTQKESSSDVDIYGSSQISLEKRQELKDMEARLYDCLNFLPEDQRTALLLKNVDDMTLAQISEIMLVSISTVSRLVIKATEGLLDLAEKRGIIL
jgi:RNA polymerase sigma factor (sigma-70 family)